MINYFKYTLTEDDVEKISKFEDIDIVEEYETKKGYKFSIRITKEGLYLNSGKEMLNYLEFSPMLTLPPVIIEDISDDCNKDEFIYFSLDLSNRAYNKMLYHYRIDALLNPNLYDYAPSTKYIVDLIKHTKFQNNDEFFDLCVVYLTYRLKNIEDEDIYKTFTEKLSYYGYDKYDSQNEVNFNDSYDDFFNNITSLATTILYYCNKNELLQLSQYKIDLKDIYLNYYQVK